MIVLMLLTVGMSAVAMHLESVYSHQLPYNVLMTLQGATSLLTFGAAALIGVYIVEHQWIETNLCWEIDISYTIMTIMLMLLTEVLANWATFFNWQILLLPQLEWLQDYSFSNTAQTVQMLDTSTPLHIAVAIVVVVLLPAVCEELFFRGVVLRGLFATTHNATVAVLFSAIFFSVIHIDAYGFLPRIVYGIALGVLFLQSRGIVYPIIAHAFNNGMVLYSCYLSTEPIEKILTDEPINPGPLAPTLSVIGFIWLSKIMVRYLRLKALLNGRLKRNK